MGLPARKIDNEDDNSGSQKKPSLKRYSYLISIFFGFVIPIAALGKHLWKNIPKVPFLVAFSITAVLGCSWSAYVSRHGWWEFGAQYVTGIRVFPNLPLEEFIFNPLGGVISVLLYLQGHRIKVVINKAAYWAFTLSGTAFFCFIAWYTRDNGPYYLYSQLVLFNFACTLALAPFVADRINLVGLGLSIAALLTLGFGWDWVGFTKGWWTYFAVTGIKIGPVHFEEFNFFLFAPTAAVSVYALTCRLFKSPQYENRS